MNERILLFVKMRNNPVIDFKNSHLVPAQLLIDGGKTRVKKSSVWKYRAGVFPFMTVDGV